MDVMPQPWRFIFNVCGISPRGSQRDKYVTVVFFIVMLIHLLVVLEVHQHTSFNLYKGVTAFLFFTSVVWFLTYNYLCPEGYLGFERDLKETDRELLDLCKVNVKKTPISNTIAGWAIVFGLLLPFVNLFLLPLPVVARLFVSHQILQVPIMQHVLLVDLVRNRFSVLNDRLASITIGPGTPPLLDRVFMIHSSLHAVVVDIDIHFSFYSLLRFAGTFIVWIQHMYQIIIYISGEVIGTPYLFAYRILSSSGYFILIALVCDSCSQTGNRTVLIAHRLLQPDTDPSIRDQVRLFSALATDNKVHFTIGGIFTLDRALVTKTALTALSYLIIFIQLRDVKIFG